jgi:hypothetical protein
LVYFAASAEAAIFFALHPNLWNIFIARWARMELRETIKCQLFYWKVVSKSDKMPSLPSL